MFIIDCDSAHDDHFGRNNQHGSPPGFFRSQQANESCHGFSPSSSWWISASGGCNSQWAEWHSNCHTSEVFASPCHGIWTADHQATQLSWAANQDLSVVAMTTPSISRIHLRNWKSSRSQTLESKEEARHSARNSLQWLSPMKYFVLCVAQKHISSHILWHRPLKNHSAISKAPKLALGHWSKPCTSGDHPRTKGLVFWNVHHCSPLCTSVHHCSPFSRS